MTASYSITCDGCGTSYTWTVRYGGVNLSDSRKELATDRGWHRTTAPYTFQTVGGFERTVNAQRDICGVCWAVGVR